MDSRWYLLEFVVFFLPIGTTMAMPIVSCALWNTLNPNKTYIVAQKKIKRDTQPAE